MNKYALKNRRDKNGAKGSLFEKRNDHSFRIYLLFFFVFIIGGMIAVRLFSLQVWAYDYYKNLADNQHSIFKDLIPRRGEIFLKEENDLYPVAVNKDAKMAYAVPREIQDPFKEAAILSGVLGLEEKTLRDKISRPNDMYEPLKHKLSDGEINQLNDLKLEGIYLAPENFRYYPAGKLASQVLGFIGWKGDDFSGRYGIENYFDSELSGVPGKLFQNKDNSGLWISVGSKEMTTAKNGNGLVLTIDHIVQYESEKILASAMERFSADQGTVIVMEPATGKILAMANYPNFDPNDYGNEPMESFRNLAVSDTYECGSVFKPITLASAIDAGKINPDTTYTDTGQVVEAGYVIKNSDFKSNGVQTMTQVLEKSLNTGAIHAEKLLGNGNFSDYVQRFGFGSQTGVDLPGESAGNISNLKNFKRNINFFTASFGQGITVTPIQLISAYNAIANEGMMMKPQLVEKIIGSDGNVQEIEPQEVRKVISKDAAKQTIGMLGSVVSLGHGKQAGVPGYLVGGKTGTAQVASSDSKGYEEGKNIGSFVGFAPIDNPQFTVLVRIDNPHGVEWAESSVAPAFGELMKFLLEYKNIKPTEDYTQADLNRFNAAHTLSRNFVEKDEKKEDNGKKDAKEIDSKPQ